MSKPALSVKRERGSYRAEIRDERGVWHYALGPTARDAEARLARSYALPSGMAGEIASADPYRLYPQGDSPYNPSILVQRRGLRVFDQMRADDQVKAALTFKKHAVFAAGWRVESPEGRPDDWEPTAFVREQLEQLEGTFAAELIEILTALDFGYSVSEKIFEEDGPQIVLRALKTRAPHAIDFRIDRHGNLDRDGILQWQGDGGLTAMPVEKFVVFRNMAEFGNPYGTSDLEAAYRAWWHKDHAYKWLGMLLERYGIPPIVAKYRHGSLNSTQLGELKDVLTNLQAATAAIVPFSEQADDLQFWTPELAGQVSAVFEPSISMYNTDIARAILMPGLLGLTPESRVGSMARARVVFDVFLFVRDFLADQVAEVAVNDQLLRPLVEMNFPGIGDERPRFKLLPIDDNLQKELFDSWVALVGAKVVTRQPADEAHIRELLEFPARDEDTMEEEDDESPEPPEDEPDEDDDADDEDEGEDERATTQAFRSNVLPGRVPEGPPVDRPRTLAEQQIDVDALSAAMDRVERQGIAEIGPLMQQVADALVAKVKRRGVRAELTRPRGRALAEAFERLMTAAFTAGRQSVRGEIARTNDEPVTALDPADAIAILRTKAFFITGIWEDRILARAREALWQSLKVGETTQGAMARLRRALEEELSPWRLEVIVRTNTTEAFNTARLLEIRRSALTTQVQFSAILDTRTCFDGDTLVHLSNGKTKPIRQIRPGDEVISGSGIPRRVRAIKLAVASDWRRIETQDGETISATATHCFWTLRSGRGRWVAVQELLAGDRVGARPMPHLREAVPVLQEGASQEALQSAVLFQEEGGRHLAHEDVCLVQGDVPLQSLLCEEVARSGSPLQQCVQETRQASGVAERGYGEDLRELRDGVPDQAERGASRQASPALLESLREAQGSASVPVLPSRVRGARVVEPTVLLGGLLSTLGCGDQAGGPGQGGAGVTEDPLSPRGKARALLLGLLGRWHSGDRGQRTVLAFEREDGGLRQEEAGCHQEEGLALFVLDDAEAGPNRESGCSSGPDHSVVPRPTDTVGLRRVSAYGATALCYDLEVESDHSYLVGEVGLIAHNTEVCRHMDGKTFRRDDPALDRFSPPLHFACRSLLLGLPPSLAVPDDELVTEAHKGRGLDLAQEGFV